MRGGHLDLDFPSLFTHCHDPATGDYDDSRNTYQIETQAVETLVEYQLLSMPL